MAKKQKYYVVWHGKEPGVYTEWHQCERQVKGVEGARYKSFETLEAAERAYRDGYTPANYTDKFQKSRVSIIERDENGIANNLPLVMYSDSTIAMRWVRQGICKSKLPVNEQTRALWDYVHRAEQWLRTNTYTTEICKWNTDAWGEIPADFGRK